MEKQLFELVDKIGETLSGDLHIIDTTDQYPTYENDKKYRVYHSKGYCFDIEKVTEIDDETGKVIETTYVVYDEWEGFEKLDVLGYIKLIENEKYN